MDKSKIEVELTRYFNDGIYNPTAIKATAQCGRNWLFYPSVRFWPSWTPKICCLYVEWGHDEEEQTLDSLFQNLYNWIKEIEFFLNKLDREDIKSFIKLSEANKPIVLDWYYISLKACGGDFKDRYTMSHKEIINFKKRLLEYTKEHNISIRL